MLPDMRPAHPSVKILALAVLLGALMASPARAQTPRPTPSPSYGIPNLGLEHFPTITCSACHAHRPRVHPTRRRRIQLAVTGQSLWIGIAGGFLLLLGLSLRALRGARASVLSERPLTPLSGGYEYVDGVVWSRPGEPRLRLVSGEELDSA